MTPTRIRPHELNRASRVRQLSGLRLWLPYLSRFLSRPSLPPLLSLLLCLPLLLAACGPRLEGEAVVFVAAPLSGDQADGGQSVVGGARLRAEQANRQGGVLGRRVVVRPLNDEADEEVAAEVARQVEQAIQKGEAVLGVIGHYNSGPTGRAMEIYKALNLVVITPSSSNPDLTRQGYDRFFRVCATDAVQGPVAARFLAEQGLRKIAVLHTDNDYGRGLAKEFVAALRETGASAVMQVEMKAESPSFAREVSQVKGSGADAVFFAGDYPDGIVLVGELRRAGVALPILASDANFVDEFVDQLGSHAEGIYISTISPDPHAVADKAWFEEYKSLERRNPGIDSTTGYSAMEVLVSAAKNISRLDGGALAAAIHALDTRSLVGRLRYDAHGDLVEQKVYVFQIEGGRFQQVYPKQ